jgi:hypothetical protein
MGWRFRLVFLSGAERKQWEEKTGPAWNWGVLKRWRLYALILSVPFGALIAITAVRYWIRWWLIQNVSLLMAIAVLGGVVVLSIQANQRRDRSGSVHEINTTERWVRWILRVTAVVTLYVVSTLGYAYAIYNHIPVQKEGGDYTTSSIVRIVSEKKSYERMVVLSQDSSYLYAASVDDWNPPPKSSAWPPGHPQVCGQEHQCGPKHWRDGLLERCGPFRPRVLAINQKSIVLIEETTSVGADNSCKEVLGR